MTVFSLSDISQIGLSDLYLSILKARQAPDKRFVDQESVNHIILISRICESFYPHIRAIFIAGKIFIIGGQISISSGRTFTFVVINGGKISIIDII